jgi:rhodanese-related sulfurtransferase
MTRSFAELIILMTFSVFIAFSLNALNPNGIPLFGQWDPDRGLISGGGPCSSTADLIEDIDVMDIYLRSEAVFVDSRSSEDYISGHIPRSVSLPVGEFDWRIDDFLDRYPLDTPLLVYCSAPDCHDSTDLSAMLKEYGYQKVSIYYKGFSGWDSAGRPIEVSEHSDHE